MYIYIYIYIYIYAHTHTLNSLGVQNMKEVCLYQVSFHANHVYTYIHVYMHKVCMYHANNLCAYTCIHAQTIQIMYIRVHLDMYIVCMYHANILYKYACIQHKLSMYHANHVYTYTCTYAHTMCIFWYQAQREIH
jgi:hypothetical protein